MTTTTVYNVNEVLRHIQQWANQRGILRTSKLEDRVAKALRISEEEARELCSILMSLGAYSAISQPDSRDRVRYQVDLKMRKVSQSKLETVLPEVHKESTVQVTEKPPIVEPSVQDIVTSLCNIILKLEEDINHRDSQLTVGAEVLERMVSQREQDQQEIAQLKTELHSARRQALTSVPGDVQLILTRYQSEK